MDIFVQRMRSAMFLKGIRQADLAKATGFSDGQVSSWFNGKYRPNAEKISLIAKALGVSVDYLLGKDEEAMKNEIEQLQEIIERKKAELNTKHFATRKAHLEAINAKNALNCIEN